MNNKSLVIILCCLASVMQAFAENKIVSEYNKWQYLYDVYGYNQHMIEEYYNLYFSDSELIGNNEYYSLYMQVDTESSQETEPEVIASMREENRRVFILNDDNFLYRYRLNPISNADEFMVMDFNLDIGDSYIAPICYGGLAGGDSILALYTITDKSDIFLGGETRAIQRINISKTDNTEEIYMVTNAIEGIGFFNIGTPELSKLDYFFLMPSIYSLCIGDSDNVIFIDFCNGIDGITLTKEMIVDKISNVQLMPFQGDNTDGKMYDLTGREIRNPLPGTVYIRDGHKAVAR